MKYFFAFILLLCSLSSNADYKRTPVSGERTQQKTARNFVDIEQEFKRKTDKRSKEDFIPANDSAVDLGASGTEWANLYVDTITTWASPSISSPTYFYAYRNGALSISPGAEVWAGLNAEVDDYKNIFNITTGSATISQAGGYLLMASYLFSDMADGARCFIFIKKNGNYLFTSADNGGSATYKALHTYGIVPLSVGDSLTVHVRHDAAGAEALEVGAANCYFIVLKLW